jgi:hypothetical protein
VVGRVGKSMCIEKFYVLRKERLQVPRCKLQEEERRPFLKGDEVSSLLTFNKRARFLIKFRMTELIPGLGSGV